MPKATKETRSFEASHRSARWRRDYKLARTRSSNFDVSRRGRAEDAPSPLIPPHAPAGRNVSIFSRKTPSTTLPALQPARIFKQPSPPLSTKRRLCPTVYNIPLRDHTRLSHDHHIHLYVLRCRLWSWRERLARRGAPQHAHTAGSSRPPTQKRRKEREFSNCADVLIDKPIFFPRFVFHTLKKIKIKNVFPPTTSRLQLSSRNRSPRRSG